MPGDVPSRDLSTLILQVCEALHILNFHVCKQHNFWFWVFSGSTGFPFWTRKYKILVDKLTNFGHAEGRTEKTKFQITVVCFDCFPGNTSFKVTVLIQEINF